MEYLAFGLLGLGAIFIFIGVLSGRETKMSIKKNTHREEETSPAQSGDQSFRIPGKMPESLSSENPVKNIKIAATNQNALLFSENAILYIDKSGKNIYAASPSERRFLNMTEIHRVGSGTLSFDGFSFFFENKKNREIYKLVEIDKINLYNNCISLLQKHGRNTLLFFIDNTIQFRAFLQPYIDTHAP
ncbi:MAG: hypothetical protein OEV66_02345 [Spirochaetia bacterium]|nr:hypothetical protein [Spirochaetia bacterium]